MVFNSEMSVSMTLLEKPFLENVSDLEPMTLKMPSVSCIM